MIQLPDDKKNIIETFAQHEGDTGSPEVQVALLSHKIQRLSSHLEENKKDNHSRRGLLKVIAKRRRIINYLQKLDDPRYKSLIKKMQIKPIRIFYKFQIEHFISKYINAGGLRCF